MLTALFTGMPVKTPKIATATMSKPPDCNKNTTDNLDKIDFLDFVQIKKIAL